MQVGGPDESDNSTANSHVGRAGIRIRIRQPRNNDEAGQYEMQGTAARRTHMFRHQPSPNETQSSWSDQEAESGTTEVLLIIADHW